MVYLLSVPLCHFIWGRGTYAWGCECVGTHARVLIRVCMHAYTHNLPPLREWHSGTLSG